MRGEPGHELLRQGPLLGAVGGRCAAANEVRRTLLKTDDSGTNLMSRPGKQKGNVRHFRDKHFGNRYCFLHKIAIKKSVHNPCTTPAQAVSRVSQACRVGRAQPFAQGIYFGEMSLSNERSCTTHPPNPLYNPARFNMIYHVWNCLESLYCCCVFCLECLRISVLQTIPKK